MAESLLSVLFRAQEAFKVANNVDPGFVINETVLSKIKPEFRDDFHGLLEMGHGRMPSLEFVAYWESDESCQEAVREVLGSTVAEAQKLIDAMRAVAEWKP